MIFSYNSILVFIIMREFNLILFEQEFLCIPNIKLLHFLLHFLTLLLFKKCNPGRWLAATATAAIISAPLLGPFCAKQRKKWYLQCNKNIVTCLYKGEGKVKRLLIEIIVCSTMKTIKVWSLALYVSITFIQCYWTKFMCFPHRCSIN